MTVNHQNKNDGLIQASKVDVRKSEKKIIF